MRNKLCTPTFLIGFILFTTITFFACNSGGSMQETPTSDETEMNPTTPQDTISLITFNKWKKGWEDKGQKYTSDSLTLYFDMPLVDLSELLAENADTARFYLGLDTMATPFYPHLMLVGLDQNGNVMTNEAKGEYIYDITKPCPPACGTGGGSN